MFFCIPFHLIFLSPLLVNSFYINEQEDSKKNSTIINSLNIQHDSDDNSFPDKFSIDLTDIENNDLNVIIFVKIPRKSSEHPVSSSDIYSGYSNNFAKMSESRKKYVSF